MEFGGDKFGLIYYTFVLFFDRLIKIDIGGYKYKRAPCKYSRIVKEAINEYCKSL